MARAQQVAVLVEAGDEGGGGRRHVGLKSRAYVAHMCSAASSLGCVNALQNLAHILLGK